MQTALRPLRAAPVRARRAAPAPARARAGDGDFGARAPKAGELESNFSDKVLGNWDTSHVIRGPAGMEKLVGLHTKTVTPESAAAALSMADGVRLRQQVAGWRMEDDGSAPTSLSRTWTAKDAAAAAAMATRLADAATAAGHAVSSAAADGTSVRVTLATPSVKGLTEADFIVAAKLNGVDVADLAAPKKARFWA